VESAVLTALEKLPADRFASAREFAEALASPGYTRPMAAVAGGTAAASSLWKWVALIAVAMAVVGGVVSLLAWPGPEPVRPVSRYVIAFPDSQSPVIGILSQDGVRLLYLGPGPSGGQQLWVKERNRVDVTPVPGTENPQGFTLSPDGQWIAVVQGTRLKKLPITGGTSVTLSDSAFFSGVAWLDDGTLVYASSTLELTRIPATGGAATKLWRPPTPGTAPAMMTPLPGGRGVLFTVCNGNCSDSDLYVYDFSSDSARQLVSNTLQGWYLPTGDLVYVGRDGVMLAVPFDLERLEIRGTPVPVLGGISLVIGIIPVVTFSATGTLLMQTGQSATGQTSQAELVWVDRAGIRTPVDSNWRFQLALVNGNNGWVLSPDGTRLAISLNTRSGDDIWIKQFPRGPLSRLTFDSSSEQRPRWTPDGQSVTYIGVGGGPAGGGGLGQRRADGTGAEQTILMLAKPIVEGFWSPDGAWIVARVGGNTNQRGGRDIMGIRPGVDSVAGPLVANPNYDEAAPALSPDGKWLAYESDETGTTEVYLRPFPNTDGGRWQVSLNGGQAPLWARSGRELFFVDGRRNMVAIPVAGGVSPGLGEPRTLFAMGADLYLGNPEHYTPFDISLDGQRFLMARQVRVATPGRAPPFVLVENWFEELKARAGGSR
jgi:serine/threonine-protein kinase